MEFEYDPDKSQANRQKHGISLGAVTDFEFATAYIETDTRFNYGETRYIALGFIGVRVYHLTFVYRGENIRPISLRKATKKEVTDYAKNQT